MSRLQAIMFSCALLTFHLMASVPHAAPETTAWLKQMLTLARHNGGEGREAQLTAVQQEIEALPKPARGDRKAARFQNDKGLQEVKQEQYEQALQSFTTASQLDPGDVEIVNNVGFAYLKTGNIPAAAHYLEMALSMAPSRAAAWANLAEVYARSARLEEAVAAYALAFRFSKNQETTRRYLERQTETADHPQVMQAAKQALALSLINRGVTAEKPPGSVALGVTESKVSPVLQTQGKQGMRGERQEEPKAQTSTSEKEEMEARSMACSMQARQVHQCYNKVNSMSGMGMAIQLSTCHAMHDVYEKQCISVPHSLR